MVGIQQFRRYYELKLTVRALNGPLANICQVTSVESITTIVPGHSWKPPILQNAELMQNVMQDHKNLHLAE
jgi:hypothetical protein